MAGTTTLAVALSHGTYSGGSGTDVLEIAGPDLSGRWTSLVRETSVPIPASGSGWHTFAVRYEGCGG